MSVELEKRIAQFEKANAAATVRPTKPTLKSLAADMAELRQKVDQSHAPQLATHGEQLRDVRAELSEMRRSQHQVVEALSRVLDRQTHDSLKLEGMANVLEKVMTQLTTVADRLASIAKSKVSR